MKQLCKNKYWEINKDYNINVILYLLIDRPNRINYNSSFIWENKQKQYHRDYDLPAYVSNGHISWYKNDKPYRENNKQTCFYL